MFFQKLLIPKYYLFYVLNIFSKNEVTEVLFILRVKHFSKIEVTEVLLNNSAPQITYMQFSDTTKQMLVGKYQIQYKELVNAYLYESQARVNNLCCDFESEGIKIADLRILVAIAQDYAATHKFLEETNLPMSLKKASIAVESLVDDY